MKTTLEIEEAAKQNIIDILHLRINKAFSNGFHNHESKRLIEAIRAIDELIPPDYFAQQLPDKGVEELRKEWEKRSDYIKTKNVSIDDIFNFFLPYLNTGKQSEEIDLIEFLEFVENGFVKSVTVQGQYFEPHKNEGRYFTRQQLVTEFKNSKGINNGK